MDNFLYYISFGSVTCGVEIDNKGIIIKTAPILNKFKGQSIKNLEKWLQSKNGILKRI